LWRRSLHAQGWPSAPAPATQSRPNVQPKKSPAFHAGAWSTFAVSSPTQEDNLLNLELVTDLLEARGYVTRRALNGEEGVRLAQQELPALILMDLRMPGMDGYAALRALRADPRTAKILIVALTAQAMNGDREAVLEAGFDGYIAKPIDTSVFPQTIAKLLS
jgi:CheY-like chemotaxis protein